MNKGFIRLCSKQERGVETPQRASDIFSGRKKTATPVHGNGLHGRWQKNKLAFWLRANWTELIRYGIDDNDYCPGTKTLTTRPGTVFWTFRILLAGFELKFTYDHSLTATAASQRIWNFSRLICRFRRTTILNIIGSTAGSKATGNRAMKRARNNSKDQDYGYRFVKHILVKQIAELRLIRLLLP